MQLQYWEQKRCNECNYYMYIHKENIQMATTQQKKTPQAAKHKISGLTKQDFACEQIPKSIPRRSWTIGRKAKLEVDTLQAVRLPVSRILLSVKAELKKELDRLEKMDIIQRKNKPTDWISMQFGCCA